MCAADPLQQQTGHLCLAVELGLGEPQLVLRLQTGWGLRQHKAGALFCLCSPLPPHPPFGSKTRVLQDPRAAVTLSSRHKRPWVGIPETSGCISA